MALLYRGPFLLSHAVSQLTGRLMAEYMAGCGMTPSDFAIYSVIHVEERVTPSKLAEILGMPPTSLSYVIRRLEDLGDLRRLANPDDGRSVLLELTGKGHGLTHKAEEGFVRAIKSFRKELDVDERHLLDQLEAMAAALERALTKAPAAKAKAKATQRAKATSATPAR
ncbi:MAG: MarR family transcriptional regulator [Frankiaceae bacterium]|nr:MarR family transcriptional regulator [Frankiaceae bacterium]